MKTYNNGPRKGMMYGGAARRKPMMYGGTATKKKTRRKAYGGGMMTATQQQQNQANNMTSGQMNKMQTEMMQTPKLKMANGGKLKPPPNPGAAALPKKVRNKMGFMAEGGDVVRNVPEELKSAYEIIKGKLDSKLTKEEQKDFDKIVDALLKSKEKK